MTRDDAPYYRGGGGSAFAVKQFVGVDFQVAVEDSLSSDKNPLHRVCHLALT